MIKHRINKWTKAKGKRVGGQASFKPKHSMTGGQANFKPKQSIIDHCINLLHLIEKIWNNQGEEGYCCFVDFKKAFDMVPRDKIWNTRKELDISNEYRVVVHRS